MKRIKRILIADKDNSNLLYLEKLLCSEYHTVCADSGNLVLYLLEKDIPDIILLDSSILAEDDIAIFESIKKCQRPAAIPVLLMTDNINNASTIKYLYKTAEDIVCKPVIPEIIMTRIKRILELYEYKNGLSEYKLELKREVKTQAAKILALQQEMIISMAKLIDSRDGSTGEHIRRTTTYVNLLAQQMLDEELFKETLDSSYAIQLVKAAVMHDIGKITVPDSILRKTDKLTDEEYTIMKNHTIEGGKIIQRTMAKIEEPEYVKIAYDAAVFHHERWDGTGYPYGLMKEQIPLCARIVAVADVFDALVSRRYYKEPLSMEKALEIIKSSAGCHFDPDVVSVFFRILPAIEEQFCVYMQQYS